MAASGNIVNSSLSEAQLTKISGQTIHLVKKKSDTSLYFVLADIHRDNMDAMKRHQIMKLIGSLSIVMILQETRAASLGK